MISGALLSALSVAPAFAQTAPAATTTVQEVVVTGSRIPRPNLTSVSPVTSVNSQEIKLEGTVDITDLLNNLPQSGGGLNNTPNPLSSGIGYTTANLRGLGCGRTLVLQDGQRLAPGDPTSSCVNLDTIPTQLVDRVEVVTGGASAVYGSDAIAGVVNFVMKKNFEGVQIDAQYGFAQHDNGNGAADSALAAVGDIVPGGSQLDGRTETVTLTMGSNSADGKGNVTGYFTYKHSTPISEAARDYAACELTAAHTCSGSENSNLFIDLNSYNYYGVVGGAGHNQFVPFPATGGTPPPIFNSSPYEYLSRADTRYQGGFLAHYDLNSHVQFYGSFNYTDDQTNEFIAPGGSFAGSPLQVNCDNPFLSAQQVSQLVCTGATAQYPDGLASLLIGRRDVEGGPRETFYNHASFQSIVGVKGDIDDVWSYNLSGSYGQTNYTSTEDGFFDLNYLQNALLVQNVNGVPTCTSVISGSDSRCVPYNIFVNGNGVLQANAANGVTKAALNYLEVPSVTTGETSQQVVNLNFVGKLGRYGITSPWAKEGLSVSFGAEYRREYLEISPDAVNEAGALDGGSGQINPVSGAYDTKDFYGEILIPVVQDLPWIHDLSMEAGYRRSDYSSAGTTGAYKFGAEYAPTRDVRFRGSFQRSVRAPNVTELYTPETVGPTDALGHDPCAGAAPTASLAACEASGVTATQYGHIIDCPAQQCSAAGGGNVALKPEASDTTSLGIIFTPTFVHNFSFSIDYFNITVQNAISSLSPNVILDECIATEAPIYCSNVHRTAQGLVWGGNTLAQGGYVSSNLANIGFLRTSGIDFESNYRVKLSDLGLWQIGSVDFNFLGTWAQHYIDSPGPGLGSYDCAGLFGTTCGNTPSWKHKLRVTWNTPWKVTASFQWRYIGSMSNEIYNSNPTFQTELSSNGPDPLETNIPAYNYFDLSGTWRLRDNLTLRAGVNNIFDKDPPWINASITGAGSPNTFSNYDVEGRTIFVGLTANY
jgi:outer membrane receptor protein involved in Fe transport